MAKKQTTPADTDLSDEAEVISRTQVKREAEALQKLGRKIYDLPKKKRDTLPLDSLLISAFLEADRIKSANALKRHFQYVGKLMRELDTEAIIAGMDKLNDPIQSNREVDTGLEQIATDLIKNGRALSEPLLEQHPLLDRQLLNQLIRNASKALAKSADANKGEAAKNKLKQYLAQSMQQGGN